MLAQSWTLPSPLSTLVWDSLLLFLLLRLESSFAGSSSIFLLWVLENGLHIARRQSADKYVRLRRELGPVSRIGTSETKRPHPVTLEFSLFWMSQCVPCSPARWILYHVTVKARANCFNIHSILLKSNVETVRLPPPWNRVETCWIDVGWV